jgi:hypothetical protein
MMDSDKKIFETSLAAAIQQDFLIVQALLHALLNESTETSASPHLLMGDEAPQTQKFNFLKFQFDIKMKLSSTRNKLQRSLQTDVAKGLVRFPESITMIKQAIDVVFTAPLFPETLPEFTAQTGNIIELREIPQISEFSEDEQKKENDYLQQAHETAKALYEAANCDFIDLLNLYCKLKFIHSVNSVTETSCVSRIEAYDFYDRNRISTETFTTEIAHTAEAQSQHSTSPFLDVPGSVKDFLKLFLVCEAKESPTTVSHQDQLSNGGTTFGNS